MSTILLNIYLLKAGLVDASTAVNLSGLGLGEDIEIDVGTYGVIHYGTSSGNPDWLVTLSPLMSTSPSIPETVSVSGVLIAQVDSRWFVATFGHGWQRVNSSAIEPNFGIRCVLNLAETNSLRGIRRFRIAEDFLQAIEQIPEGDEIRRFGMDVHRDLLRGVKSSSPKNSAFGTFGASVTGGDSFKAEVDLANERIGPFLSRCLGLYQAAAYKTKFAWVDNVEAVRDASVISALDETLATAVRLGVKGLSLSVPDVLAWDEFDFFGFEANRRAPVAVLLDINQWKNERKTTGKSIDLQSLRENYVYCYKQSEGKVKKKFTVYECLHGTLKYKRELYLAHGGKWFKLDKSFVKMIDEQVASISLASISLPPAGLKMKEGDYNLLCAAASGGTIACLDKQLVQFGGGKSSFELCDLLTATGIMICVKPWGGKSGSLSHLFQQARATADLVTRSEDFRQASFTAVPQLFHSAWKLVCNKRNSTEIALVVLRGPTKERLPFFAKLSLARIAGELKSMRFRPSYACVPAV
jgi:uncharacterized protein (TIGR04141 family)